MQSSNFVPGVSGWKMHKDGSLEVAGSVRVVTNQPAEDKATPRPFIVVDGVTYISQAEVEAASITGAKIADMWSVKLQVNGQGQYVTAGIGLGAQEKQPTSFDKAVSKGADAVREFLARTIAETQLGAELKAATPSSIADHVLEVIRTEMRPGGLLHRA